MEKSNRLWGWLIVLIIVLAFVVPYTLLSDVQQWYGSFLWWSLTALAIIVINAIVTRDWRE